VELENGYWSSLLCIFYYVSKQKSIVKKIFGNSTVTVTAVKKRSKSGLAADEWSDPGARHEMGFKSIHPVRFRSYRNFTLRLYQCKKNKHCNLTTKKKRYENSFLAFTYD